MCGRLTFLRLGHSVDVGPDWPATHRLHRQRSSDAQTLVGTSVVRVLNRRHGKKTWKSTVEYTLRLTSGSSDAFPSSDVPDRRAVAGKPSPRATPLSCACSLLVADPQEKTDLRSPRWRVLIQDQAVIAAVNPSREASLNVLSRPSVIAEAANP